MLNDNPFSLKGKNLIITGGSSGIGQQCAISCSQMGANIVLIGRNIKGLEKCYHQLSVGNHLYFSQDITDYDKIEYIIQDAVNKLGKINGFIHAAGIEITQPLSILRPSAFEQINSINFIAGFEFARILSKKKYHVEQNLSLVYISSIMSIMGSSALVAYSASKGALNAGIRSLAIELAEKKVRANSISPAHLEGTRMSDSLFSVLSEEAKINLIKMHPLGLGTPLDVANACIYLLSDASRWVTGTNLIIDGGYSAR